MTHETWEDFLEADARDEARAEREWQRRRDAGEFDDEEPENDLDPEDES